MGRKNSRSRKGEQFKTRRIQKKPVRKPAPKQVQKQPVQKNPRAPAPQSVIQDASTDVLLRELSRRPGLHLRTIDKPDRYVVCIPEPVYSLIVPKRLTEGLK